MSISVFNKPAVIIGGGSSATLSSISISSNGTYGASAFGVDGFDVVDVDVQGSGGGMETNLVDFLTYGISEFSAPASIFSPSRYALKSYFFNQMYAVKKLNLNKAHVVPSGCFISLSFTEFSAPEVICIEGASTLGYCNFSQISTTLEFPKLLMFGRGRNGYIDFYLQWCSSSFVSLPNLRVVYGALFPSCTTLKSVYAPELAVIMNDGNILSACSNNTIVDFPKLVHGYAYTMSKVSFVNLPKYKGIINIANNSLISSFNAPFATSININNVQNLSEINCPYIWSFGGARSCPNLKSLFMPLLSSHGTISNVSNCGELSVVYIGGANSISASTFLNCSKLESIYLLNCSVMRLGNTNAFGNTPMSNETLLGHYGSIYVPSSWVASYKASTNWLAYSDRITSIPPEIESKFVFASEYINNSSITEIPSAKQNAEYICTFAFYNTTKINAISFPNCKGIGQYAFYNCSSVSQISLPQCEVFHSYAFNMGASTTFYASNAKYIFDNVLNFFATSISALDFPELIFLGSLNSFRGNTLDKIAYINMPKLVTLFNGFGNISSASYVNFDELVCAYSSYSTALFSNARGLTGTISFPKLVTNVYFSGASNITSVYAPCVVDTLSFSACSNITSIYAPNQIYVGTFNPYIGTKCSTYDEKKFVNNDLTGSAFCNCHELTKYFNLNHLKINNSAFYDCRKLSKVFLRPSYFETCFNFCSRLNSVYIYTKYVAHNGAGSTQFNYSPISNSTSYNNNQHGSIFVPMSLLSDYQNDSLWSWYSQRIVGLTDEEFQDVIDHWDD